MIWLALYVETFNIQILENENVCFTRIQSSETKHHNVFSNEESWHSRHTPPSITSHSKGGLCNQYVNKGTINMDNLEKLAT